MSENFLMSTLVVAVMVPPTLTVRAAAVSVGRFAAVPSGVNR